MSAEWSSLAPGPEEITYLDEVQQGLTAGQTFCGRYYSCQNSEAWLLLAPAMLHDGDPGRGVRIGPVQLGEIREIQARRGKAGQSRRRGMAQYGGRV